MIKKKKILSQLFENFISDAGIKIIKLKIEIGIKSNR